jgi:hypothetical protein
MDIQILEHMVEFDLYGLSGDVANFDFGGTGKRLMDEMWQRVRDNELMHKGVNFWVYDSATRMFTGVEIIQPPDVGEILEHKPVSIARSLLFEHVGPYEELGDVHRGLETEMAARGLKEIGPRIEKYGHWTPDTTKLVTEVFIGIE